MARTISFINYKGGVGKTTTTYHIGCALAAQHGFRVLLIDADPQTNLTFLCSDVPTWQGRVAEHGSIETLYRSFIDDRAFTMQDVIWQRPMAHARLANVDLVPSNITLLDIDLRLQARTRAATTIREVAETHISQRSILSSSLKEVAAVYDYILIDCPPNLYLATQNALYASDGLLITLMPDHFSTIGVRFLDGKVAELMRERALAEQIVDPSALNNRQIPSCLAFVRVNVTAGRTQIVAQEQMAIVRGQFGPRCFDSKTEDFKDVREATTDQTPVFLNSPSSQNSQNYLHMTDEFLRRFPLEGEAVQQAAR